MTLRVSAHDFNEIPAELKPEPTHTWTPSSLVQLAANPPAPPTIAGLLYPGRRTLLSGETESLKTWFALIAAKAEIEAGYHVAWADLDAMGPGELLARLREIGLTDPLIDEYFHYYEPTESLKNEPLQDTCELIQELKTRLFVIDAFNPMLGLHGLDPNSTPDIETFWREIADPICRAGAAPSLIDHVVKNNDNRGKYSYGSERKASGAIVHIGFRLLEPFSRGNTGRTLLSTHKDRPGHLPRPTLGKLVLESDGESITYKLEADHSHDGNKFRPTFLMQRVSEYLETCFEPVTRKDIEDSVKGQGAAIRTALDALIEEGYATQTKGARGAKLVESFRPYTEADDDFENADSSSSRPRPDLVFSLRSVESSSSSRPPLMGDEDEVGTTSSSEFVQSSSQVQEPTLTPHEGLKEGLPADAPEWERRWWAGRNGGDHEADPS